MGPDPYKLVYEELEFIKGSLKKVLTSKGKGTTGALTSNEVLTMAAREFMQRKGKSFRPMLVLLIGVCHRQWSRSRPPSVAGEKIMHCDESCQPSEPRNPSQVGPLTLIL